MINGGYIELELKLGICPGAGDKPKLPDSSYAGGADLDGTKKLSSAGIDSETIIMADAEEENHKAGRNAIRLDGSFTPGRLLKKLLLTEAQKTLLNQQLVNTIRDNNLSEAECLEHVKKLFEQGSDGNYLDDQLDSSLHNALDKDFISVANFIIENVDLEVLNLQNGSDNPPLVTAILYGKYISKNKAAMNEIAKKLIDKGVDLTLENVLMQTPLEFAGRIGNTVIVDYIENLQED